MNYQTGDYIRFHTPEQWQQIVEKLERDGQRIFDTKFIETYSYVNLTDSREYWSRSETKYFKSKNDITDKFFEAILQDELCSNPPLEVGDEFTITCTLTNDNGAIEVIDNEACKITSKLYTGHSEIINLSVLEKKLSGSYFNIEYGSYKQANPVREFSVKPKVVPQVNWKALQETYVEFSIEQSKKFMENWLDRHIKITYDDGKKRLISLSGKACPRYYSMTLTGGELLEMFEQGFTLADTNQWYFAGYATSGKTYEIMLDMFDQTIYQNTPHNHPERVVAIKSIKSLEGVLDLDQSLEKLDMISDSEYSMFFAEAANEEEYQKWLKCVENHHKMMLEAENEYRAECFKYVEDLK